MLVWFILFYYIIFISSFIFSWAPQNDDVTLLLDDTVSTAAIRNTCPSV